MASTTAQMQQRHDTAANWTAENPILALGELGLETDTGQWKGGDGVTHWNDLDYLGVGPEGPAGPPGGVTDVGGNTGSVSPVEVYTAASDSGRLVFHVKDFGAVGDGVADDTSALQAAFDAAEEAGGTVYIGGTTNTVYRITGPVLINGDTGLYGDTFKGGTVGNGSVIKLDSPTAQVRVGDRSSDGNRGAALHDFTIDGNNTGDPDGAFYLDLTASRSYYNIAITDANGHGMVLDTTQNCTFNTIEVTNCRGIGIMLDNGAGGNLFLRCEVASNDIDVATRDTRPGAHSGYPFGPSRNLFIHCIFEDYNTGGTGIARGDFTHGQTRFQNCAFSASMEHQSSGYVVKITQGNVNQFTSVTFATGCTFNGHNDTDGVYAGANTRTIFEGIQEWGGCPNLIHTDSNTSEGRINARMVYSSGNLLKVTGSGSFAKWYDQTNFGRQVITDPTIDQADPLTFYQRGEVVPRLLVKKSGDIHFNNGSSGASNAFLGLDANSDLQVTGGFMTLGRRGVARSTNLFASGAVTLNTKTVAHWQVNASADITSMAFSNPVNNAEFVLQITRASNSTVSITWPTDVRWARDGMPPVVSTGNWTFIGFRYDGTDSTWKEMWRSEEVGNGVPIGRDSAPFFAATATFPDLSGYPIAGQTFRITMSGNHVVTTALLPNPAPGGVTGHSGAIRVRFQQDATGSRTLTLNAAIKTAGGTDPVLSTAANAVDIVEFAYTGTEWVARMLYQGIA